MVFPVHLQRSAVAAILDCPVRHQFTGPESLKPVALQLIWLFQESLLDSIPNREKDQLVLELEMIAEPWVNFLSQQSAFGVVVDSFRMQESLGAVC